MHDMTQAIKSDQWGELYILAENWQSDLEFYRDDLRFLHHLVDKYFIWITKSENLELVRELMLQVQQLERKCKELIEQVMAHKSDLSKFSKGPTSKTMEESAEEHQAIHSEIATFVKNFRSNRTEVFRITEYVIDSEELSGLIRS